jgi:hypothetical protein
MQLEIASSCTITPRSVFKNGQLVLKNDAISFAEYAKQVYHNIGVTHPKFFKMDDLCKLCFLTCEILLADMEEAQRWEGPKVAVVMANKTSSLHTDRKHFDSIKERNQYFPSPALFVYTLPNIMLGEICIRHKITGENTCFLMENFDTDFFNHYVHDLFNTENYEFCIAGWVDYQPEKYESHLLLVRKATKLGTERVFDSFLLTNNTIQSNGK